MIVAGVPDKADLPSDCTLNCGLATLPFDVHRADGPMPKISPQIKQMSPYFVESVTGKNGCALVLFAAMATIVLLLGIRQ